MKFAKPLLVVTSVALAVSLTACGKKGVDTAHMLPDPNSTIGNAITSESASPGPTESNFASPSPSHSKFIPSERNKTETPVPSETTKPEITPVTAELWQFDVNGSVVRAIYSRNLHLIDIASIVADRTPVADVKAIANKQQSQAKAQNVALKKYLVSNNIEVPKLTDRLPNVFANINLEINPRSVDQLKTVRANTVEISYYKLLQQIFADFRTAADTLKGELRDDNAKSALSLARKNDDGIVDLYGKYLEKAQKAQTNP